VKGPTMDIKMLGGYCRDFQMIDDIAAAVEHP
jgi:hypothetical protein